MRKHVGIAFLGLLAAGCGGRRASPPVPSPDGSMTLATRIEQSRNDPGAYLCVVFEVRDGSGRVLHSENTRASDTMRWNMSWISDRRIRLQSSDIGTSYWDRQEGGTWVKEQPQKPADDGDA